MGEKLYLYAEVLANIRQVTLYASLQSWKNEQTDITVASNKRTITVYHDGEIAQIFLPTKVAGTAKVTLPVERAKELSLRLEIADPDTVMQNRNEAEPPDAWAASTLTSQTSLACHKCHHTLHDSAKEFTWKDLPSQNWAEMMDYWHCHRPSNGQSSFDTATSSGYGPSDRLKARQGTALVDVQTFLMSPEDCLGIKESEAILANGLPSLLCAKCNTTIGFSDKPHDGWRIYKWTLVTKRSDCSAEETISAGEVICAQILALIESIAIRKFVLHSDHDEGSDTGILLWVFNPDLRYTSSTMPGARRAMKVFYQITPDPLRLLNDNSTSLEELYLPSPAKNELQSILQNSTGSLPMPARKFQNWDVALLDRYELGSSSEKVEDVMLSLVAAKG
ncbi:MAG: hypothetical protein Q9227_005385 [Pyrenula ochraceoflavens]